MEREEGGESCALGERGDLPYCGNMGASKIFLALSILLALCPRRRTPMVCAA